MNPYPGTTEEEIVGDIMLHFDNKVPVASIGTVMAPECEWEEGRIEIRYQGKARPHREIATPEQKPVVPIRVGENRRTRNRGGSRRPVIRGSGRGQGRRRPCGPLPPLRPKRSA